VLRNPPGPTRHPPRRTRSAVVGRPSEDR
jgi:hypothetical protein